MKKLVGNQAINNITGISFQYRILGTNRAGVKLRSIGFEIPQEPLNASI
jgi:hypothetical protein